MSRKQCKKLHFGFCYIIIAPIGFDQEVEVEAVADTRQLWIWEAVSPKSSVPEKIGENLNFLTQVVKF